MGPVRIALLGCGEGALRHHVPILAGTSGVEIAAVAEPDEAMRAAALRHARRAIGFDDWREALEVADLHAAIVCLPNDLHAPATLAALTAGRAVYVEKPLATSLVEAETVLAAWRRAGVTGMIGFNYRFNALYRAARRHLRAGRLGEVVAARSVFTIPDGAGSGWKRSRDRGGGVLLDLGSHHFDLARWLLDAEIVQAQAWIESRRTEGDTALVHLRLANGIVLQSLFSFACVAEERFEIYGRDASLLVDRSRRQDAVLEVGGARGSRIRRLGRAIAELGRAGYVLEKRLVPGHEPSHRAALARFAAAIRAGSPVEPDLEDGYASLAAVAAAELAAREARPAPVATVPGRAAVAGATASSA